MKSSIKAVLLSACVMGLVSIASASTCNFIAGISCVDGSPLVVEGNTQLLSWDTLVADGTDVKVALAGYAAADEDVTVYVNGLEQLFTNGVSPLGSVIDLGNIADGTPVTFEIDNTTIGQEFYTNPALNSDGTTHAGYTPWVANSAVDFNGIAVGLEDLPLNISDRDGQDQELIVSGVREVPEPQTIIPLSVFFGALVLYSIRRRRSLASGTLGK